MTTTDTNSIRPLQRYRIEIDFATRFGGEAELLQQRINEFLESDAFVEGGALDEIKLHMSTLRALAPAGTPNADAQRIAQSILNTIEHVFKGFYADTEYVETTNAHT